MQKCRFEAVEGAVEGAVPLPPLSPDLTFLDFLFWGVTWRAWFTILPKHLKFRLPDLSVASGNMRWRFWRFYKSAYLDSFTFLIVLKHPVHSIWEFYKTGFRNQYSTFEKNVIFIKAYEFLYIYYTFYYNLIHLSFIL